MEKIGKAMAADLRKLYKLLDRYGLEATIDYHSDRSRITAYHSVFDGKTILVEVFPRHWQIYVPVTLTLYVDETLEKAKEYLERN